MVGSTKPDAFQTIIPLQVMAAFRKIASSSKETANKIKSRWTGTL
jgi:hypothetical protein